MGCTGLLLFFTARESTPTSPKTTNVLAATVKSIFFATICIYYARRSINSRGSRPEDDDDDDDDDDFNKFLVE
ncbi:hypothetical protein RUM43_013642 [Polyplax serrata]|uniref:Uncharacterized protein n=1 Tax=Polyplax serrata TaxID=468196 RepID=A0AAN8NR34_POLSC